MSDRRPGGLSPNVIAGLAAAFIMLVSFWLLSSGDDTTLVADTPATTVTADTTAAETSAADTTAAETTVVVDDAPAVRFSDLPTITLDELPIEAIETLFLIADGGPYPYRQDDSTFQNREGILPDRELGHYREYTVDTPGSPDRGARRIVAGADGEQYYTDDHYDSFREIIE